MRTHCLAPRFLLQRFAPPVLTGPVHPDHVADRQGRWVDVCGVIASDSIHWAERLVSFGNYRLIPVPLPVSGGAPIDQPQPATRSTFGEGNHALAMHVVANPGFGGLDVQPLSLGSRPLASRVYLARLQAIVDRLEMEAGARVHDTL